MYPLMEPFTRIPKNCASGITTAQIITGVCFAAVFENSAFGPKISARATRPVFGPRPLWHASSNNIAFELVPFTPTAARLYIF